MASAKLRQQIARVVRKIAGNTSPALAAARHAVSKRIPQVDFLLEVRDARLPISSECDILYNSFTSRRIIVLNKLDLAIPSHVKEWLTHFEKQNFPAIAVDCHSKQDIQKVLNLLEAKVRSLNKTQTSTITIMLIGIPNVGKSALSNALHQIGRITAAESGKLKYAVMSSMPGETTKITSFKVASHPSVYILDTPGMLPPLMNDCDVSAKLALIGAFKDSLVGEKLLAQLLLSIVNMSNKHRKAQLSESHNSEKKVSSTDHIKLDVRCHLAKAISSFKGNLNDEEDMMKLISEEFLSLREVFNVYIGSKEKKDNKVAVKLLKLFRTGRLGPFMLDSY